MKPRNFLLVAFAAVSILFLEPLVSAQVTKPPITREHALAQLKGISGKGWKEVISDEGRFRVVFPAESVVPEDDVISVRGYKLVIGEVKWSAVYSDLDYSLDSVSRIRETYHRGMEAMLKNGTKLVRQRDVIMNGRLGNEVILQNQKSRTFMMTFLIASRLYVVSVDIKDSRIEENDIPQDVQRFFDSFTFWVS